MKERILEVLKNRQKSDEEEILLYLEESLISIFDILLFLFGR